MKTDFAQFYADYARPVRNFLFRLGARVPTLDDLTQETFIRAWKNLAELRDPRATQAWLFRIALHQFYDWGRTQKTKFAPLHEQLPDPTNLADAKLSAHGEAMAALAALSTEQRAVCLLHYLEEFSIAEISGILRIPEATVKTRLLKAREKMQNLLTLGERIG